jgi:outer membrane protein assembly factor BamB
MRILTRSQTITAALAFTMLSALCARADDWPQYMGPTRDGVWHETGIIDKFPEGGPKVRWRVPVNSGYSGPAVVGGKVFVMDRVLAEGAKNHDESMFPHRAPKGIPGSERVLCFNAADGKQLWKHEYDCAYTVSYPSGPRTTPTVHDGLVYTLGTEGHLCCFKADSGDVVWKKDFGKEYGAKPPLWGHSAHPLIDGNKLICVVGGEGSVAVAFDKNTGKELWRALSAKEQGYAAPMIYTVNGQRQLIIWHAQAINGLDPETGKVFWTEPAETYAGMSIATPSVSQDKLFLTAYPALAMMLKLDATTASVTWKGDKKNAFYTVFSSPHFENDFIYGVNSGKENAGMLTCIKADSGERVWESLQAHGTKKPEGSAEIFLVKNGDHWFLANEKGDLIIANLTPKGYEELSRAHLLDPTSTAFGRKVLWSHPAYAEKCAFMRNDKELICVELGAK